MFQRTLGLRTNPFNPQIDPFAPKTGLSAPNPQNWAGEALRVDLYDELSEIFCWKFSGLMEAKSDVHDTIFGPGAAPGNSAKQQLIIVIRGDVGTGKTTFASYIKRMVESSPAPAGKDWLTFETSFKDAETEFAALATNFATQIKQGTTPATKQSLLTILDDIPTDPVAGDRKILKRIVSLYGEFKVHFRIFIVTTADPKLTQNDLFNYEPPILLVDINKLSATDIKCYIEERVSAFRAKPSPPVPPLFPFDPQAPAKIFGDRAEPVRVVNKALARKIDEKHKQLIAKVPNFDVDTAAAADLAKALIP